MKNELRLKIKQLRSAMDRADVINNSTAAARIFLSTEIYKSAKCIMLYKPLGNETDTSDIIKAIADDGKKMVFPKTDEASCVITPYLTNINTSFEVGAFSVFEPINSQQADKSQIDVVIVPGIAFDKSGSRIGFGKGCYDSFLMDISAIKVGFCYDFQLTESILTESHDVKMNYIVTEKDFVCCQK